MEILQPDTEGIAVAKEILEQGGVVAHATETCYGLACDLRNADALKKLFAIKDRPGHMPVSALFATLQQAKQYLEWNDVAQDLATKHLPGPLTIILKAASNPPATITVATQSDDEHQTIGLRLSPHKTAAALATAFGFPLSTTSANVHSEPNPYSVEDLLGQYEGRSVLPDLILDDGPLEVNDASTIVNISDGTLQVLRQGNIAL